MLGGEAVLQVVEHSFEVRSALPVVGFGADGGGVVGVFDAPSGGVLGRGGFGLLVFVVESGVEVGRL